MFRKIIDKFKAAAQPDPARETVYVSGSHGELVVDLETGFVLEYYNSQGYLFDPTVVDHLTHEQLEDSWAYYNIIRFDLSVYPREIKPDNHFDILELGYLYNLAIRHLGVSYLREIRYEWPEPAAGLAAILSSSLNGYALGFSGTERQLSGIVTDFRDLLHRCGDYTGELSPPTKTGDHRDKFGGKSPWRAE